MSDYKLVPVEPTLDMMREGMEVYASEDCAEADVLGIYKAMLAAAPAVQGGPDVATQILSLISDECRYWQGRDEARRGGYAILYAKAKELISNRQPAPDVEALEAIQKVATHGGIRTGIQAGTALGCIAAVCDVTLAAHRKQGGEA